jgi:hypothetical protein
MKSPFITTHFVLGISLEIGSVILCYFVSRQFYYGGGAPFVQLFFAITYFIGSYLIFKTEISYTLKFVFVFWWVAVGIGWAGIMLVRYGIESSLTKNETYLLPDGYHGKVTIQYNQPSGNEPIIEGDRVVFNVQANGEVRTTFKRKLNKIYPNNSRSLYFYVTASGQRIPIKMAEDPLLKESEVAIFSGGYSHGETGSEITESDFLIFTKQEADAYYHKR